ncbi:hypothetical protein [Vibrio splendidus]|uniref:hypothetical protein n=1 Tax=Vibrio splendidus TaxID=29497 RepID=UPI00021BE8D2|nr:hypothetical protein [Vibrio splendidus]EGU43938.1 hypothetical protein VISP3789_22333 [Vibrio splendidus ATCC 33789]
MKFSPIYAALLTSLASISAAHAAQHSQNIAEGYGADNIPPNKQCLDVNPNGASQYCVANFKPEGLTLEPNQKVTITTPVSFPDGVWFGEQAPSKVVIRGSDNHNSTCSSLGDSQWSCVLPESGFHSTGVQVEMWIADGVRNKWGGDLIMDDLIPDAPEIENASATFAPAKGENLTRDGKMWLATQTPINVTLDFDLVNGSTNSFANQPIRVLLEKTVGTGEDNTTTEWVTLSGQASNITNGHNTITGQVIPSQGWDSAAFYSVSLGYKLNDNDTPVSFVDPQGRTTMTGQGAYLSASPMRIVDSNNPDSTCVLTQNTPESCDFIANGSGVKLTGLNVWQDDDNRQSIQAGTQTKTLQGGHVTSDVAFDLQTTGKQTFTWNNVSTVVTYNTDANQIVLADADATNDVIYDNAYINGAVTKVTNKGNRNGSREARNTGIQVSLDTLDHSAISGLESVTWSVEYPLVELVKVYAPELPSLAEDVLKLAEQTINSTILANASEFSEEGQFYLDVATLNDSIADAAANLGGEYAKYLPRFANVVLPLDLVANYRVHGVDKVKSKRFNIAIGDRGKRIVNFESNGNVQCLTNVGGKFAFQDCDTSQAVNENTDPNVLFKFVPAAPGTITHPTNVFQVRPASDDTQCLTVNGYSSYNVVSQGCNVDAGVSQLFSFKAQSDNHLEESIVASGNTAEMTISSLWNGRVFDRSGGGAGGSQWGDLIVYPKNGDKGSMNQHMFVSRFGIQNEANRPQTVPVDLTMRCQTGGSFLNYWSRIQLTATNKSDYDAYVRVNWNERWELVRAGTTRMVDNRLMSMPVAFDQVYRFFPEFNPHNAFFSLPANETKCEAGMGRPNLDFTETKKGYNAWTVAPE